MRPKIKYDQNQEQGRPSETRYINGHVKVGACA